MKELCVVAKYCLIPEESALISLNLFEKIVNNG